MAHNMKTADTYRTAPPVREWNGKMQIFYPARPLHNKMRTWTIPIIATSRSDVSSCKRRYFSNVPEEKSQSLFEKRDGLRIKTRCAKQVPRTIKI